MGSTSFLGFSYPNLLLVFLNLFFLGTCIIFFSQQVLGLYLGLFYFIDIFCTIFWVSLKGQVYKSSTSTFSKTKTKTKTNIVGRNRTTVNAIVRVSIRSRNFGALRARGFIHAPGLLMGSKPWLACACERSRRPRASGEKTSADLKKLQQILTMVQLSSNLRDN